MIFVFGLAIIFLTWLVSISTLVYLSQKTDPLKAEMKKLRRAKE
jgi:hypothetical protein